MAATRRTLPARSCERAAGKAHAFVRDGFATTAQASIDASTAFVQSSSQRRACSSQHRAAGVMPDDVSARLATEAALLNLPRRLVDA